MARGDDAFYAVYFSFAGCYWFCDVVECGSVVKGFDVVFEMGFLGCCVHYHLSVGGYISFGVPFWVLRGLLKFV